MGDGVVWGGVGGVGRGGMERDGVGWHGVEWHMMGRSAMGCVWAGCVTPARCVCGFLQLTAYLFTSCLLHTTPLACFTPLSAS